MIYDLEEPLAIEEVLDNLFEEADVKRVVVDNECVTIDIKTYSGQFRVKRFIKNDKVSIAVV